MVFSAHQRSRGLCRNILRGRVPRMSKEKPLFLKMFEKERNTFVCYLRFYLFAAFQYRIASVMLAQE